MGLLDELLKSQSKKTDRTTCEVDKPTSKSKELGKALRNTKMVISMEEGVSAGMSELYKKYRKLGVKADVIGGIAMESVHIFRKEQSALRQLAKFEKSKEQAVSKKLKELKDSIPHGSSEVGEL